MALRRKLQQSKQATDTKSICLGVLIDTIMAYQAKKMTAVAARAMRGLVRLFALPGVEGELWARQTIDVRLFQSFLVHLSNSLVVSFQILVSKLQQDTEMLKTTLQFLSLAVPRAPSGVVDRVLDKILPVLLKVPSFVL